VWTVEVLAEAEVELNAMPDREQTAMHHAFDKLENEGPRLPSPHSSQVKGAGSLRELRPRQGRSAWRAFYRRLGDTLVVAAIGPEAQSDRPGFDRAVRMAQDRLQKRIDERGESG